MSDLSDRVKDVIRGIEAAFPVQEVPPDGLVRNDHCRECSEVAAIFLAKTWRELAVGDLKGNPSPSLLTATVFRSFLPGMMVCVAKSGDELGCFSDELVGMLSPPRGNMDDFYRERVTGFSAEQAAAIVAFLELQAARERAEWSKPEWPPEAVEAVPLDKVLMRALEYWIAVATGAANTSP